MKSKTSFFNPYLFWKNVALCWPIWGFYLAALLVMVPGTLWFDFRAYGSRFVGDAEVYFRCLNLETGIGILAFLSVAIGVVLHNYLYVARNANMIHALPVSRLELFGTNLVSGLSFMLVPQFVTFMVSVFLCLGYGQTDVQYLGMWFLVMTAAAMIFYSMVEFCAMLTGQAWTLIFFYGLLNSVYLLFQVVTKTLIGFFGYGMEDFSDFESITLPWLSPVYYLFNNVTFFPKFEGGNMGNVSNRVCTGLVLVGWEVLVLYLGVALIFYGAAWWFYRKRHLETAGDLITVKFVKPIFRWGVGFMLGYTVGIFGGAIFEELGYARAGRLVILFAVFFGGLFFCLAEMLVKKNFRVFKRRMLAEGAAFLVCMALWGIGIKGYSEMVSYRVPDAEDVAEVTVNSHYEIAYRGDEIEKIVKFHKAILERTAKGNFGEGGYGIGFSYRMKDGRILHRQYFAGNGAEWEEIRDFILAEEKNTEHFLAYLLGEDYENRKIYRGGVLVENEGYNLNEMEFSAETARSLAEAVIADANAGVLQKYNVYIPEAEEEEISRSSCYLYFYFDGTTGMSYSGAYMSEVADSLSAAAAYYEYMQSNGAWSYEEKAVFFGEDCTNIIRVLEETGLFGDRGELEHKDSETLE